MEHNYTIENLYYNWEINNNNKKMELNRIHNTFQS